MASTSEVTNRNRLKEAVNLAGSVASLTGISLLWLKDMAPTATLAAAVPAYFLASLLSIGIFALAYVLFSVGYNKTLRLSLAVRVAYVGLVGFVLLFLTTIPVYWAFFLARTFVRDAPLIW